MATEVKDVRSIDITFGREFDVRGTSSSPHAVLENNIKKRTAMKNFWTGTFVAEAQGDGPEWLDSTTDGASVTAMKVKFGVVVGGEVTTPLSVQGNAYNRTTSTLDVDGGPIVQYNYNQVGTSVMTKTAQVGSRVITVTPLSAGDIYVEFG